MNELSYSSPAFPAQQVFTAVVTEVDSNLNVYFRVVPENGTRPIHRVIEAIESACVRPTLSNESLSIGKACLAKSVINDSWQRAIIERIDKTQEMFIVRFVDYGTVETIKKTSLRSDVIASEIPELALRGYLYNLKLNKENVESMKAELHQILKECLLDKFVVIRWENYLAQLFPIEITIKIPGQGIFRPISEETDEQQADETPVLLNGVETEAAMKSSLSETRRQFGSMNLNRAVNHNGSVQNVIGPTSVASVSNDQNITRDMSVRPKVPRVAARSNSSVNLPGPEKVNTRQVSGAIAATNNRETDLVRHMLDREEKRLIGVPVDVTELLCAITMSPFKELHPELVSNVFYPVIICEHVTENYCFLQTMPINEPSNDELDITIRHTVFMTLIDSMRNDVNSFNLVQSRPPLGTPVCAQFDDEEWYRAVVLSISPTGRKLKVLYVDYGNTREISYNQLRELPEKYIKVLPTHSFLVKLYNIRPSGSASWSPKKSETLRQALLEINVSLVAIFSRSGYPLEVDLYESVHFNDRVPCRHPLQKLVDSGEFEFVVPPIV